MKTMTRRTFLKTTGTIALAVGAAGALTSCGIVDDALNDLMDKNGVAGVTHNGVGVSCNLVTATRGNGHSDENNQWVEGKLEVFAAYLDISSISSKEYDLSKENFKLKVDGVEAEVLPYEEAKKYATPRGDSGYDLLLDQNNKAHIGAGDINSRSIDGAVMFKLKNDPALDKWTTLELNLNFGPGSYTFTGKPEADFPDNADITAVR